MACSLPCGWWGHGASAGLSLMPARTSLPLIVRPPHAPAATFPVFHFSPLIPTIIIMVIIIYGVLTEGLATQQIKRCCDMCLPAVMTAATSSFCSGRLWKTFPSPGRSGMGVTGQYFLQWRACTIYNRISWGDIKIQILGLHPRCRESESECPLGPM